MENIIVSAIIVIFIIGVLISIIWKFMTQIKTLSSLPEVTSRPPMPEWNPPREDNQININLTINEIDNIIMWVSLSNAFSMTDSESRKQNEIVNKLKRSIECQ